MQPWSIIIIIIIHYIYIALFKALKALYIQEGNLLNHHQCAASTWMMRRQPYCARTTTTHQLTGGEETVMKPISVWGILGGHDGQRPMGKFGQDAKCVNDKQNTSSACSSSAFSEQIVFKLKTPSLLSDAFITQNRRINKLLHKSSTIQT